MLQEEKFTATPELIDYTNKTYLMIRKHYVPFSKRLVVSKFVLDVMGFVGGPHLARFVCPRDSCRTAVVVSRTGGLAFAVCAVTDGAVLFPHVAVQMAGETPGPGRFGVGIPTKIRCPGFASFGKFVVLK